MENTHKKIGVVMTYYNRQYQLNKTLESINRQNYNNLFVVIVDDNSSEEIVLPKCNFEVKIIRITDEKRWTNPEPAYNRGFIYLLENTDSEIIINQNAETYHVGNVLEYASNNVSLINYITFGCYNLDKQNTFNSEFNVLNFINTLGNDRIVPSGKQNGWYNHPIHRPVAYEFCSAIHKDNLIKLNGYDERFSLGSGYGDDFLLHRIRLLGLNVVITTNPIVVHQWHESVLNGDFSKNQRLLQELRQEGKIKAVHLFNKDLC
jgi:glycosyltransferase involved in cell wall biosynthesis